MNLLSRLIRVSRAFISMPFAFLGITFMGIAVWIMPKPKRLESNHD